MKRLLPLWVLLLSACAAGVVRHSTEDRSYEHVESLVSQVGPRFAGSEGDAKAVAWALSYLKMLGFSNVHAEPVTVPHWVRGPVKVSMGGQPLEGVALGGSVPTPEGGVTAKVIRVDSLEALEWTPDEQVRGKIVFFDGDMKRTADGTGYRDAVPVRSRGPTRAARKGALAVVIRSVGTDHEPVAHTGSTGYDDAKSRIAGIALTPPSADALRAALAKGEVTLSVDARTQVLPDAQSANVIADVPGRTDEVVLLGAHLDSWDITPGASDDGAGVATVIEAARQIMAKGEKPQRTIRVVLYANEEFGLSGAKAYAAAHAAELDRHVVAMEADFGSGAVMWIDAKVSQDRWSAVERAAAAAGVKAGKNGEEGGSDIGALRAAGVPILGPRANGEKYFDVHHTERDTLDTIDRVGLAQNAAVYRDLAWFASQEPGAFGRLPPEMRGGHTLRWDELAERPLPPKGKVIAYGKLPQQFGELRVPAGKGPFPVAVLIHGGCWKNAFSYEHATRIAAALSASGIAAWTIEYRRLGDAGAGWPNTFIDVAKGADALRELAAKNHLDLKRVIAIGHSAGGQLALWLATRGGVAPGSELYRPSPLALAGVIGLAPITNLSTYGTQPGCGESVTPLLGGTPSEQAARYAQVSPVELPAPKVPVRILQGTLDRIVPMQQAQDYLAHVPAAQLIPLEDMGHFEVVAPASGAWVKLITVAREMLGVD